MNRKKTKPFVIKIYCSKCNSLLYLYEKEGPGALVKCYTDKILKDNTSGDLRCPQCHQKFARLARYHNRPAHKIIGGKVVVKGHCGK